MGLCKLTKTSGKFVKSHIIPKALTRPTVRGNKFIQKSVTSAQSLYIKRADSWYDQGIVTREGENYLSDFDAHAIKELRDRGILWSSNTIAHPATSSTNEIMVTSFENPNKMRLFFLSLLWRASVSTLAELADIILPSEKVERLRRIIIGEEDDDLSFFPTALIQLTEKGPIHNFIPIKQTIGQSKKEIIRFYMDGLIAHMHLEDPTLAVLNSPIPWEHSMFIGHSKTIIVQVKTSDSFHLANLTKLVKEYEQYRNDKPGI
jgi:hypothetical protein